MPDREGRLTAASRTLQASPGSTGLGLSISYTVVGRYGGRITVNSRPSEGSDFVLWLRRDARYDAAPSAPGLLRRW
ncbi:ATP-binding protein [Azoarcus sp. KH32C]|uniref:ATP-binding protein n=1 Tax=Azoarcus sp. KH32C TaxID=748247 RepID=UPI00023860B8|nr:hypothetical protein AZKH_0059 [Azoarcus sp. KH32C]